MKVYLSTRYVVKLLNNFALKERRRFRLNCLSRMQALCVVVYIQHWYIGERHTRCMWIECVYRYTYFVKIIIAALCKIIIFTWTAIQKIISYLTYIKTKQDKTEFKIKKNYLTLHRAASLMCIFLLIKLLLYSDLYDCCV